MAEIHYFPRYSQPENVVTNNTLLLFLRLYDHSRFKFEKFLSALCGDQEVGLPVPGLQFRQQVGTGKSVVDGYIAQDSLRIAIETKLSRQFDLSQLERHLAVFTDETSKLLILLSPTREAVSAEELALVRSKAALRGVSVVPAAFEDVAREALACLSEHDEEMLALANDYASFCSETKLLPRDACILFAPGCGRSFEDNLKYRLYYCPAAWSRREAAYLGIYANRAVRAIGRIAKVVACEVDADSGTVTELPGAGSLSPDERHRILAASQSALANNGWDLGRTPHKFYLCDRLEPTEFRKESPGGMRGHRYFDLEEILGGAIPESVGELAQLLRRPVWT